MFVCVHVNWWETETKKKKSLNFQARKSCHVKERQKKSIKVFCFS